MTALTADENFNRRGGPPCPPVSGMSMPVRGLGQARRPVPTANNLEGRIGLFQHPLKEAAPGSLDA